jgi:hypothetical protein
MVSLPGSSDAGAWVSVIVLNLRSHRDLLFLLGFCLALAAGLWASAARPGQWSLVASLVTGSPTDVGLVGAAWGSAPGEFGRGIDRLGRPQGPSSFAVDSRGQVVIADTHNHRLVRYDARGQLQRWQVELAADFWATAVAVDGRGRVYAADGTTGLMLCYDASGRLQGSVSLVPDAVAGDRSQAEWVLDGIVGDQRSGVFASLMSVTDEGREPRIVKWGGPGDLVREVPLGRREWPPAGAAVPWEDFCLGPLGELVLVSRAGPFTLRLEALGPNGAARWSRDLPCAELVRAARLMGCDRQGRVYLLVDLGQQSQVLRVPPEGETASLLSLASVRPRLPELTDETAGVYSPVPGRVDSRGRLYLIASTRERFVLRRIDRGR